LDFLEARQCGGHLRPVGTELLSSLSYLFHNNIMASTTGIKDRILLAVIGDEVSFDSRLPYCEMSLTKQDSVTGLLLAGIGHVDQQQKKNFLIVDGSEPASLCHIWVKEADCR
jgi:hypothetical protein